MGLGYIMILNVHVQVLNEQRHGLKYVFYKDTHSGTREGVLYFIFKMLVCAGSVLGPVTSKKIKKWKYKINLKRIQITIK